MPRNCEREASRCSEGRDEVVPVNTSKSDLGRQRASRPVESVGASVGQATTYLGGRISEGSAGRSSGRLSWVRSSRKRELTACPSTGKARFSRARRRRDPRDVQNCTDVHRRPPLRSTDLELPRAALNNTEVCRARKRPSRCAAPGRDRQAPAHADDRGRLGDAEVDYGAASLGPRTLPAPGRRRSRFVDCLRNRHHAPAREGQGRAA